MPFLGWYIAAMGMVFVDRTDRRKAVASVGRAGELLAAGGSLVSFPEGTRSAPGELGRFKSGGFAAVLDCRRARRRRRAGGDRRRGKDPAARWLQGPAGDGSKCVSASRSPVAGFAHRDRAALARRAEEAVAALLGLPAPRAGRSHGRRRCDSAQRAHGLRSTRIDTESDAPQIEFRWRQEMTDEYWRETAPRVRSRDVRHDARFSSGFRSRATTGHRIRSRSPSAGWPTTWRASCAGAPAP